MIKKLLASALLIGASTASFAFTYDLQLQNMTPFGMVLSTQVSYHMDWRFPELIMAHQSFDVSYNYNLINSAMWGFENESATATYQIQCPNNELDELLIRAYVDTDWHYSDMEASLRLKAVLLTNHCAMLAGGGIQTIIPRDQPNFSLIVQPKS